MIIEKFTYLDFMQILVIVKCLTMKYFHSVNTSLTSLV